MFLSESCFYFILFFSIFSVHLPTSHYLIFYFNFFPLHILFAVSVIGTPDGLLTDHGASVAPVSLLCWYVWSFLLLLSWLGKYWALIPHYHLHQSLRKPNDLCCQMF